jgi:murein DD-endopeptidase MepM/ murein hydrolase activator NlpD
MFRGGDETFANRISPPGDWLAYAGHRAIDIIHSVGGRINGLPIYSVSDGRVLRASTWENYGETVYVQSENHRLLYAHLQVGSYEVVLGQFITTANKLGKAGNSPGYYVVRDEKGNVIYDEDGNAVTAYMSPHLHFEVRNKDGTDRLNPRHFFPEKVFD